MALCRQVGVRLCDTGRWSNRNGLSSSCPRSLLPQNSLLPGARPIFPLPCHPEPRRVTSIVQVRCSAGRTGRARYSSSLRKEDDGRREAPHLARRPQQGALFRRRLTTSCYGAAIKLLRRELVPFAPRKP